MINPKIFKAYDIRGIYPSEVDEEGADRIARAIYIFFKEKIGKESFTILLARDTRLSSPSMFEATKKALVIMGANIIDAGLLSTPTFYFAVTHHGYDSGIQITASHNPKQYTGMKFVINTPKGLLKIGKSSGMEKIKELATGSEEFIDAEHPGSVIRNENVGEEEVNSALKILSNPKINKFRIVADPANAMGITYLTLASEKVPMDLIKMNFDLDGTFPAHEPDPIQLENIADLRKKVLTEKADLGVAPDGDGDRIVFIDENGNPVSPSIINAIVAREMLRTHPGERIVVDVRYIFTPKKIIEENGGELVVSRVGHAFISQKLGETGAIFGGESSGHYFFRETGNAESPLIVLFIVLKVMSEESKTLSEIVSELRRSYESGESGELNFELSNANEVIESIKEKYKDGKITSIDCLEIEYPDWRMTIRTSNTEPLVRLSVEAYDKKIMEIKRDELVSHIKSAGHFEEEI